MAYKQIAYEKHPVTPERKRELNAKGFKIVDIAFAPADHKAPLAKEPEQEQRKQRGRPAHVAKDEDEE